MAESRGERIVVDPRRDFQQRRDAMSRGLPLRGRPSDPPPGLLPAPGLGTPGRWDPRLITPGPVDADLADPYREALRVQIRPGQQADRRSRVRVYHRPDDEGELCWCFTITRAAFDRLRTEGLLDSDGAVWPDGRPIVEAGADPLQTASVRCGTCGTHTVECLQIEFFQD